MTDRLLSLDEVASRIGLPCDTPEQLRASRRKAKSIVIREFETYYDLPHIRDNIKVPEEALQSFLQRQSRAGERLGEVGGEVGARMGASNNR